MTYLLDSNVCIRLINNSSRAVTTRLAALQPEDIYVSTITQLELYYGAYRSAQQSRNDANFIIFVQSSKFDAD